LEEQVLKNKNDIAKHYEVDRVIADWGIKVLGVVDSVDNIPVSDYEYGDAFGISSTSPMQYVVWTRANVNVGENNDYWLNIGALSLVGPQGPQGIQGPKGEQGVRGSNWTSHSNFPTASQPGNVGDQWLETTTGDVYQKGTSTWTRTGNIKGPQGVQGPQGARGLQGIQGPQGPQGPKGDTGSSFTIGGILESIDFLPTPTQQNRNVAYAVAREDDTYDLYVVVGTTNLQWVNMGRVEGVEGPQGPVGPQGPAGADIQIVTISGIPSTATSGTLTQEQVQTLLAHPGNYIQFFNENFYPQDVEIEQGYIVYSHVGQIGNETKIKNINLTIATGGWVLTETSLVSAPITIVNELPEANEENFEKGNIYTTGELLQYISKVALSEPNIEQVATLVSNAYGIAAAAVGTDIYLFGGKGSSYLNTISKFSTTTGVLTTLSATLPTALSGIAAAAVGTDIYLFGGYTGGGFRNTINKFSTTTGSITTLSTTLPQNTTGIAAATVGTDIYLFGGSSGGGNYLNTISKFSTTTGVLTTLSATLPTAAYQIAAAAVGTDIYLFGGKGSNSSLNTINKFSTTTGSITTLSTTLPQNTTSIAAAAVGTDIYLFGGETNVKLNTMYEVAFGFEYTYKTIQTQ
jgi:hypothetical protein